MGGCCTGMGIAIGGGGGRSMGIGMDDFFTDMGIGIRGNCTGIGILGVISNMLDGICETFLSLNSI